MRKRLLYKWPGCRVQRRTQNLPEVCTKYTITLRAAHTGLNPLLQRQKSLLTKVFNFHCLLILNLLFFKSMKTIQRSLINNQSITSLAAIMHVQYVHHAKTFLP